MNLHLPAALPAPLAPSRRQTTLAQSSYLVGQLPLSGRLGERGYLRDALLLRVAEGRADERIVRDVLCRRHYLAAEMQRKGRQRPFPPRTKLLHYLADLAGFRRPGQAAGLVTVRIAPRQCHAIAATGLHPCAVLEIARSWRADDLSPEVVPHLMSHLLHQVFLRVRRDWIEKKVKPSATLRAEPQLLVAYSDPAQGHDGGVYLAAGATPLGHGVSGKLLFGWGLTPPMVELLRQWRNPS